MKSEAEIRQKLHYYEGILAGMEAGGMIDHPDIFLRLSQRFPKETMDMLNTAARTDELVGDFPVEDQPWVRQWFGSLAAFARQVLEARINILRWSLEQETDGGGNRGRGSEI